MAPTVCRAGRAAGDRQAGQDGAHRGHEGAAAEPGTRRLNTGAPENEKKRGSIFNTSEGKRQARPEGPRSRTSSRVSVRQTGREEGVYLQRQERALLVTPIQANSETV